MGKITNYTLDELFELTKKVEAYNVADNEVSEHLTDLETVRKILNDWREVETDEDIINELDNIIDGIDGVIQAIRNLPHSYDLTSIIEKLKKKL